MKMADGKHHFAYEYTVAWVRGINQLEDGINSD